MARGLTRQESSAKSDARHDKRLLGTCMQALAVLLCLGIYLLVHHIWKSIRVPPGREGQVTLVCCGVPMQEERREKIATQLTNIKLRCTADLGTAELNSSIRRSRMLLQPAVTCKQ